MTIKVEYIDGGRRYRDLGVLTPEEKWTGDTREELAQFYFEHANEWIADGFAWECLSSNRPYPVPDLLNRSAEAYFSPFQVIEVRFLLTAFNRTYQLDPLLDPNSVNSVSTARWRQHALRDAETIRKVVLPRMTAALCQMVSSRYFPKTQSDQRTIRITVSTSGGSHGWDWYAYAQQWNSKHVTDLFKLTRRELFRAYETLALHASHADPLRDWSQLVQFVSVDQRQRLRGSALLAETMRTMAQMLRLLYEDRYGQTLPAPHEIGVQILKHIPEQEVRADTLQHLEFIANAFHVNPRPRLVLIVEGPTEAACFPIVFERLVGTSPSTLGIELVNLGGVSNVTGGKADRYRAIVRLIDYLHHHQTICFVTLDNEGQAPRLKRHLAEFRSLLGTRRYATRREYMKVWRDSFEFDNFTLTEIANALHALSRRRHSFTRHEVGRCRLVKGKREGTLEDLYARKTGRGLNKVALSKHLLSDYATGISTPELAKRPIGELVQRLTKLALRNHAPVSMETWLRNQRSRFLSRKGRK